MRRMRLPSLDGRSDHSDEADKAEMIWRIGSTGRIKRHSWEDELVQQGCFFPRDLPCGLESSAPQ